jgi:hypothetical protein
MESSLSVILDKLLQWIFSKSGKKNNYSIHSNEICSVVTVYIQRLRGSRSKEREMRVAVFDSQLFLTTQFSVPNPAVFLLSKKLFLVYIFVHIDDKKPYKPFNQLDTSSRHTASSSPVNKELLHFYFVFFNRENL